MTFRKILCSALLTLSTAVNAGVTPWLDFQLENGHIAFPVTIANQPTYAILDSGSQIHAINQAFVAKNELEFSRVGKVRIQGVFGEARRDKLSNVPVGIFGSTMELDGVIEMSLGHHSRGLLLGAPLFYGNIMQIDYPNNQLRLITRDAMDLADFKNIPMVDQRGTGMPLVEVALNGRKVWLVLDTGNSGGIIIERTLAESFDFVDAKNEVSGAAGATRESRIESLRIKEVVFGPYTLENVLVSFNAQGSGINLKNQFTVTGSRVKGKRVVGLIGYDVLKHFILTMDYGRGHMHVGLPEDKG